MVARKLILASAAVAAISAACAVVPAMGAEDRRAVVRRPVVPVRAGIGSFTPASADPRLAAALSRAGLASTGFRFTPSGAAREGVRAVTVAVRARTNRGPAGDRIAAVGAAPAPVALAPIAYNLGAAVGWKRFALSGGMTRVDLAGLPGSREAVDVGVSYAGKSFSTRVKAAADRPLKDQPQLVADQPSYSLDVGGSYSLTRNLDVTAGVQYRTERDRLERLPRFTDTRRDSQSVYVGTAFRF